MASNEGEVSATSSTPSISTQQLPPGLLYHRGGFLGATCVMLRRFRATNVDQVQFHPAEYNLLVEKLGYRLRSAQYVAWRGTLLFQSMPFFVFLVAVDFYKAMKNWGGDASSKLPLLRHVNPRYLAHFDGLLACHSVWSTGSLVVAAVSVACAALAAFWRTKFKYSSRAVQASFLCSYLPVFGLLLVIPFRHGVDFEGIQRHICRDLVNGPVTVDNNSTLWPGRYGHLADELSHFNVTLPSNFCDLDAREWGDKVSHLLHQAGHVLDDDTGTCPAKERSLAQAAQLIATAFSATPTVALSTPVGACPQVCGNCTTEACAPHLARLSLLAAAFGSVGLTASIRNALGEAAHCSHCFASEFQCAESCSDFALAMANQALVPSVPEVNAGFSDMTQRPLEHVSPSHGTCVKPEEIMWVSDLVFLGTRTSYWKMVLGSVYALMAVANLLPIAFSLMLGAVKGSEIAKTVVPYSRLPGVIIYVVAFCLFPFVFIVAVIIQTIFGGIATIIGLALLLLSVATRFLHGLVMVRAEELEELHRIHRRSGRLSNILGLVALILFAIALVMADFASVAQDILRSQDIDLTDAQKQQLRYQIVLIGLKALGSFLGKSIVATIFFADSVVVVIYKFHHAEDEDPADIQYGRMELIDALGYLVTHECDSQHFVKSANQVAPDELEDEVIEPEPCAAEQTDEGPTATPKAQASAEKCSNDAVIAGSGGRRDAWELPFQSLGQASAIACDRAEKRLQRLHALVATATAAAMEKRKQLAMDAERLPNNSSDVGGEGIEERRKAGADGGEQPDAARADVDTEGRRTSR